MSIFAKISTAAVGAAMIAGAAAPAAAQSQYGGYNNGGGIIGTVIQQILGGGRYGAYGQGNDRVAVDQCARAAEARVAHDNRARYGGYNQGYGQGYGGYGAYGNQSTARVVGITGVERRSSGLRVRGVINSGMQQQVYGGYGNQGYDPRYADPRYGNQGYNAQAQADLRFTCRIDMRGRVTSLDIRRNEVGYRGGY